MFGAVDWEYTDDEIPPDATIEELQRMPPPRSADEGALLWGTVPALEWPALIQGDIDRWVKTAADGYFLIGFWGHGTNSHAFYYVRVDGPIRVFFRLHYGGIYMDNEAQAKIIPEFITQYLAFEQVARPAVKSLVGVESMGCDGWGIETLDGSTVYHDGSLLERPNFSEVFGRILG